MENLFKYKCGDVLKDKVTGYVGVVMSRTEYFTGCIHYGMVAKKLTKEGKIPGWQFIDEIRLVITKFKRINISGGVVSKSKPKKLGGPLPNTPAFG